MYDNISQEMKKKITINYRILAVVFLIYWILMNFFAELICSHGFFICGLIECVLVDGFENISLFGVSYIIDFVLQCTPLFFGWYYLNSLKRNKLDNPFLLIVGIISIPRMAMIEGYTQYEISNVIVYLYVIYVLLNIILIMSIVSEMKKTDRTYENNKFAGDFFRFLIRYIIGIIIFFIVFSLGIFIYNSTPKRTAYISVSGTHSLGSTATCEIDNTEIVLTEPIRLEKNSVLYSEYLMGYKLSAVSPGETKVTLNVYDGGGDVYTTLEYAISVKDDLSLTISRIT